MNDCITALAHIMHCYKRVKNGQRHVIVPVMWLRGHHYITAVRPNKVNNMFLVLLPGHFCEVVMVTFLFTACCYSYTMLWIMYKNIIKFKEILCIITK